MLDDTPDDRALAAAFPPWVTTVFEAADEDVLFESWHFTRSTKGKGYAVIVFERRAGKVEPFLNKLESMARERGMQLGRRLTVIDGANAGRDGRSIEDFINSQVKVLQNVGLVVCVIGDKTTDNAKVLYPAIKVCPPSQPLPSVPVRSC